jgi:hypothetical protein
VYVYSIRSDQGIEADECVNVLDVEGKTPEEILRAIKRAKMVEKKMNETYK